MSECHCPRILVSGLSGGAGKTIVSLGLSRCFTNRGLDVRPFKKGPDYIDAVWLGLAAAKPASNLDPHFLDSSVIRNLFADRANGGDIAVIEGNRGLFDGMDVDGSCASSELARILTTPVILSLDCTKMTRTAAAVMAGIAGFEDGLVIGGVILNRTAGPRHRKILRETIEHYTDIPVLGALPKISPDPIPERHMGLVSNREYAGEEEILDNIASIVSSHVDVNRVLEIASAQPPVIDVKPLWDAPAPTPDVTIGYVRDAALWFYYEENLDALRQAGAELVELTLLDSTPWPEIDGLLLGGGFPETLADQLYENEKVRDHVKALSNAGLPIYAECGGMMYLTESLTFKGRTVPMAGVFPVRTELCERPSGLGYIRAEVVEDNPYHPKGKTLVGHEFHYSHCLTDVSGLNFALSMERGTGMLNGFDGLMHKNTFAGYAHIHAFGTPWWADNFVQAARKWKSSRRS